MFGCVVGATLPLWIPAPYQGTGHAFDRRNDEFGGGNHSSRIGVRDMLSYQAQSFRLATISSMAARMVRVLSRDSGSS